MFFFPDSLRAWTFFITRASMYGHFLRLRVINEEIRV
jgi:hypothetical protein